MATITSAGNPAVKAAGKLARRRDRERTGTFLVEGPAAVAEALPYLTRLFVVAGDPATADLARRAAQHDVDVLEVTGQVLDALADTVTPQGVVGVATLPSPPLDTVLARADLVVVLHDVRDPGNVGTIVRTADAAGADAVLLTGACVDPRNPKAVRASAGSLFHLPVLDRLPFALLAQSARQNGLRVLGADARGRRLHTTADLTRPCAVVLGSEAHGLPADVKAACDDLVRVPLHRANRPGHTGSAESLNLAVTAAVLLYEADRQRRDDPASTPARPEVPV